MKILLEFKLPEDQKSTELKNIAQKNNLKKLSFKKIKKNLDLKQSKRKLGFKKYIIIKSCPFSENQIYFPKLLNSKIKIPKRKKNLSLSLYIYMNTEK